MDIIEMASKLGEAIAQSEEMADFNKAEEAMEKDPAARSLMDEYKRLQLSLVRAAKEKKERQAVEDIKKDLLEIQKKINEYTVTSAFLNAKAGVDRLVKTVNDVIMFKITGEEPCSKGNCSSCGGGCK